jgi:DNA polymerase III epsilon subunit family exonuclease
LNNLIKFINKKTNNKYNYLKLSTVSYNKQTNCLNLVFLYPDEIGNIVEEDRKQIEQLTLEFVALDLNLEIKYVKSFYDEEYLKTIINNYNKNNYPALCSLIKTEDLKLKEQQEYVNLDLHCLEGYISKEQQTKYLSALTNYLNNEFFYKFEIELFEVQKALGKSVIEKNKQEALEAIKSKETKQRQVKVEIISQIIGDDSSTKPLCVSSINKKEEKVSIAGTIKYLQEREFTKKQKVMDAEVETFADVKKTYYSFSLEGGGKEINCVYFPNQQTEEKIKKLENNMEVILTGDVDVFNDKFSFKIKHITECKILDKKINETVYKSVPKSYKCVFPEDYEVVTQANLFDDMTEPTPYIKNNTFVVFDLETTGLNHEDCQIVEIGAVKIENGKITKKFSTFVDPEVEIPLDATRIHGITDAMVMGAPKVGEALADFYKFCENSTIVAYNIDFDYKFINYYGKKHGYNFNHPQQDAMIMARKYIKGLKNYKLKTVCEALAVSLANAHRAYFDAAATAKVFLKLAENMK